MRDVRHFQVLSAMVCVGLIATRHARATPCSTIANLCQDEAPLIVWPSVALARAE